jgi:hypothetical protein
MALKLINLNKGGTSISFVSSSDFQLGNPIYYKTLGNGSYSISGSSPNKTINLTTNSAHEYATGTTRRLFIDFSNVDIPSDNYSTNVITSTSFTITNQSTSATGTGTFTYYDFYQAKSDNSDSITEYVVSNKNDAGGGTYSYTALKVGEIILSKTNWDLVKENYGTASGLTPGQIYYLSPTSAGKLVTYIPSLYAPVLKAISKTRAFIDLSLKTVETGVGDSLIRETFTGNGSTSVFTLTKSPAGTDYTTVFIDGVFQIPTSAWSLSGFTVTFTDPPYNGAVISIQYARSMLLADASAVNKMVCFSETVSGSPKNTFNIPSTPANISSTIVFVGGSIQDNSKYYFTGNVLTFYDSISVGLQVIAYVLNSSGITTSFDQYVTRKEVSLGPDSAISVSSIFESQTSGQYRIFDLNDPRISAIVSIKHNGTLTDPDVRVDSNSSSVSIVKNTSSKLNIYIESNVINFQNKTTNSMALKIYKEI